jgi:hypothetical protein
MADVGVDRVGVSRDEARGRLAVLPQQCGDERAVLVRNGQTWRRRRTGGRGAARTSIHNQ